MRKPEFVRVTVENGSHVTVSAAFAEMHNLKPLKRRAVDRFGRTLRAKHKVSVAAKATGRRTAKTAASAEHNPPSGSASAASDQEDTK